MATVVADFQDRKRIVFTSRGRAQVNVREQREDGPVGFTSVELLLVALGNCVLGTLLNHELLRDAEVNHARASLDAEVARDPARVTKITVDVDLEVEDPALLQHREALEGGACACPICNTLSGVEIVLSLQMRAAGVAIA